MSDYFDELEVRSADERASQFLAALRSQLHVARSRTVAYGHLLADIDPEDIQTLDALARLPITRKSDLARAQKEGSYHGDPFGGYAVKGWRGRVPRVFQSPGPMYEPQAPKPDPWRLGRALFAAGFKSGDLIHNCFSYHFTPAGAFVDEAARSMGCTVFPGGTGQTEQQLQAMLDLQPQGYVGTPSFLRILIERATESGQDLFYHLRRALVSGEAFPAALRQAWMEQGLEAFEYFATSDVGLIAYETPAREGLVIDESVWVEIVRPDSGDPVPEGEVGELLVTVLSPEYPLLRFATGDLSAFLPGPCPSGRTARRIRGWMGRADQATKVRGMFVHPQQIAEVLRAHPDILCGRLVVSGSLAHDHMTLHCEIPQPQAQDMSALTHAVQEKLRAVTKLRGDVQWHPPGTLPTDGKFILDERPQA